MTNPTKQDWAKWQAHRSNKDRFIEEQELTAEEELSLEAQTIDQELLDNVGKPTE